MSESAKYEYEKFKLATIVILVSIVSLVVIAVSYWLIMREDSTVLVSVSSLIGSIIGYYFKTIKEYLLDKHI
ncbi:MAG: hypothetical protein QXM12_07410 [Nitrososphaerota archaeon]